MNYIPFAAPLFIGLLVLLVVVILLLELRVVQYAYEAIGISRRFMFALLFLSFAGSYVNIAVARLPPEPVYSSRLVWVFGVPYVVPVVTGEHGTVLAVNVGGALIPLLLSVYLIAKNHLYASGAFAVAIVTVAVHLMAHPVPGVGIVEPAFIPPVVAAAVALLISRQHAGALAYVAGSLGTLIGADLLNLNQIRGLGAPIAAIGGAGKFDGIFLTGLLAVLLASLVRRRHDNRNWRSSG